MLGVSCTHPQPMSNKLTTSRIYHYQTAMPTRPYTTSLHALPLHSLPNSPSARLPSLRLRRRPSSSRRSPRSQYSPIGLSWAMPRAVSRAQPMCRVRLPFVLNQLDLSQALRVPTPPSRSSEMDRSARSGSVIGMGRYPPIRPCPPCSVVPERDRSGPAKGWLQSSG